MTRRMGIIAAVVAVVVLVASYFLLIKPKGDEVASINEQRQSAEQEQDTLRRRITTLEGVRANAPKLEAAIVAAESIIPRNLALPSIVRQLQVDADDSGARLVTVSPARPAQVADAQPGLSAIQISMQVEGGYFQLVDFLRRVEDPSITPRGIVWSSISITPKGYPTLGATVSGTMFALLPAPASGPGAAGGTSGATASPAPGASPKGTASPTAKAKGGE